MGVTELDGVPDTDDDGVPDNELDGEDVSVVEPDSVDVPELTSDRVPVDVDVDATDAVRDAVAARGREMESGVGRQ